MKELGESVPEKKGSTSTGYEDVGGSGSVGGGGTGGVTYAPPDSLVCTCIIYTLC